MENCNQIKFSILIPAYKSEFLKEAIESVLGQSYKNLELIVVDDCSPENIKSIVDGFSDSRMSYYRNKKNCGAINVVDNWNKCLSYATGDYVICMGDDDKLTSTCLSDYIVLIKKYPGLHVYHTRTLIINEESEVCYIQEQRPEYESGYSLWWHRWMGREHQYIGDFLYERHHLIKEDGFFYLPLAWASDDITAVRAALPLGIANVSKPGFCYRRSNATISSSADERVKSEATLKELEWYKNILIHSKPEDDVDKILVKLLNVIFSNHFKSKIMRSFCSDIYESPSHVSYWYKHRKVYYLSPRIIISSLLDSLRYNARKMVHHLLH